MSIIFGEPPGYGGVVTAEEEFAARNLVGKIAVGASKLHMDGDSKRASRYVFPTDVTVTKIVAYMDGLSDGDDSQPVRAILYDSSSDFVLKSEEVLIEMGQEPGWVTFPLEEAMVVAAGSYDLGLHAGVGGVANVYGDPFDGDIGSVGPDVYSDGPLNVWGSRAVLGYDLSIFAVCSNTWVSPSSDLTYVAELPYGEAQGIFRLGGPRDPQRADCGWHGTSLDPERGSFCLVDPDGPLADRVGEVVRVQAAHGRVVFAYCHEADSEINGDISLSRRLYSMLALLTLYPIPVTVTTIPGTDSAL